jgi:hypothetical protein
VKRTTDSFDKFNDRPIYGMDITALSGRRGTATYLLYRYPPHAVSIVVLYFEIDDESIAALYNRYLNDVDSQINVRLGRVDWAVPCVLNDSL